MSTGFDPYHVWLGIPASEQPANHYRLLGIPTFEASLDVIENAADQRMAHLRTFQTGKRSALSQRLLNEIAAARLCLLDVERKAAYDAWLATANGVGPWTATISPPPPPGGAALPAAFAKRPHKAGLRGASGALLAVAAIAALLAGGSVVQWHRRSHVPPPRAAACEVSEQRTSADTPSQEKPADAVTGRARLAASPSASQPTDPTPREPASTHSQTPRRATETPFVSTLSLPAAPRKVEPTMPARVNRPASVAVQRKKELQSQQPAPSDDRAATMALRSDKLPIPPEADQQKALAMVKAAYKADYERADTVGARRALAKQILDKAVDTTDNASSRFVLLRVARDLAATNADGRTAFRAVDELAKSFQVDPLEMKGVIARGLVESAKDREARGSAVEQMIELVKEAIAADQFMVSEPILKLALAEAGKLRDKDLQVQLRGCRKELDEAKRAYASIEPAMAALKLNTNDAEANLTVGRHYCLTREAWGKGLPYLAKGSDAALRSLASADLKSPDDTESRIKVADGWWDLAQQAAAKDNSALLRRAAYWYRKVTFINDKLVRAQVQARLAAAAMEAPDAGTAVSSQLTLQRAVRGSGRGPLRVLPATIDDKLRLDKAHGPYKVSGQTTISPEGGVAFERGTLLLMAANASLVANGKLESYGSSAEFVRFRPEIAGVPFDKIRLVGPVKQRLEGFDVRGAMCGLCVGDDVDAEVKDCLFLQNKVGIETQKNYQHSIVIDDCMIANNLTDGITVYLNRLQCSRCTIANNGGIGVNMTYYGDVTLDACEIAGNKVGVLSQLYEAKLTLRESNIVGNRTWAMELKTKEDFQCADNYWGTANLQQITAILRDGRTKPGLGRVLCEPFAKRPRADAGCSLKVPRDK